MSTVQSQMLKFVNIVDPRIATTDALFAAGTVGTVAGDRFSAQRQLDMYNDARRILADVVSRMTTTRELQEVIQNTTRNAAASAAAGVFTKPTGYIFTRLLQDSSGKRIAVLNPNLIADTSSEESSATPIVYEESTVLRSVNGNTYIPDVSTYLWIYVAVTDFVLSDVTGGVTTETFTPAYEPKIIQVAEILARGQGLQAARSIAEKLIGGQ